MGRNYESELELVQATTEWAAALDLSGACAAFGRLQRRDLIVVASGGSVAAAYLLAELHSHRSGRLACVMTPLEFAGNTDPIEAAVCFISAGGRNNDILLAWNAAPIRAVREVAVLCANSNSPLARLAHQAGVRASAVFDVPAGRDGFLATNSLIAFCTLILRLYDAAVPTLPPRPRVPTTQGLLERDTLVILYGGWLKPVAVDLESRFTEAALGVVQLADFRNFAHGRHHWLAKRGDATAVLALISPTFAELAQDTLAELPQGIPVERWTFSEESPSVAILGLQRALELAGAAAARLGYDAGRPGVPEFGHHIYDLRTLPKPHRPTAHAAAVTRKVRACGGVLGPANLLEHLTRFETSLHEATFAGVVLDYDGTVVSTGRRFEAIEPTMAAELNRLLSEGMFLGIATGRGKSVHEKLQAAILPEYWSRCTVGYYNGGTIRTLAESCAGLTDEPTDPAITLANAALQNAPELVGAAVEMRPRQITITRSESDEHGLWMKVSCVLERSNLGALRVVHSSHSVDVIPLQVSKRMFVESLARATGVGENNIAKIGDRGRWPGNDADLLAMSHGLSVDEISGDPDSCWNLAPPGLSGPAATLYYLQRIQDGRYRPALST